jgi:hypothetical protein
MGEAMKIVGQKLPKIVGKKFKAGDLVRFKTCHEVNCVITGYKFPPTHLVRFGWLVYIKVIKTYGTWHVDEILYVYEHDCELIP